MKIAAFGPSLVNTTGRLGLPGQAVFDHERQQIAAVSRAAGNIDLFVIGFDNHVWTTFWNDQAGWNPDWFRLPGQAVFDREHQKLAVESRAPGNIDLFVIGFDNHVWTTFWNDRVGWNADFFQLPGQAVFDRERQQLAAVSRAPGNLDVFVIGFDNHVWTTFWNDRAGWNTDFFQLPGQAVFDRERQQLAVVSRAPGNLDVFVIGFDNRVWTTFWNDQVGWNPDFFQLPGQAVFDREHQQLAVVSRSPGNLDPFLIGNDDRAWTTFWNDQVGWNQDFFALPGQAVFDRLRQRIAAVSRTPGNLDLFVIGNDNHVWTTFWGPRAPMTLDVTIDQTSPTVPLQVGVHIKATDGIVTETNWSVTQDGVRVPGIGDSIPAGVALDRILAINDPGTYVITVNRSGLTGPGGTTTLTKQFNIRAARPGSDDGVGDSPTRPRIEATHNGPLNAVTFDVRGKDFLGGQLAGPTGITVRFVDGVDRHDWVMLFTGSDAEGDIQLVTGPLDTTNLKRNALGQALVHVSATDSRRDPASTPANEPLWSNTITFQF